MRNEVFDSTGRHPHLCARFSYPDKGQPAMPASYHGWRKLKNERIHRMSANVVLTENAARRISEIVANEPENRLLRVSVEGGGCSGFQYKFDLVPDKADDDTVLERDGATVLIDPVSLEFLEGSEIDFVDELIGASFQIRNPNATASCGCGTSFSL